MVDESEEQECSLRISGICIPVYGNYLISVIIFTIFLHVRSVFVLNYRLMSSLNFLFTVFNFRVLGIIRWL